MNLTVNDWDRPAALLAAATFLQALAAIPREGPAVDYPDMPGSVSALHKILDAPTTTETAETLEIIALGDSNMARAADPRLPVDGSPGDQDFPAGVAAVSDSNMLGELPPARVDMKGVAFNPDYCSEAKDPFYSSGPNQGQWKCRRGVPGATYDHWYSNELAALSLNAPAAEPAPLDVSQAFAGPAATAAPAVTNTAAPTDCGKLMVWVSEQQVAGNITPEQVQAAYTRHNLTLADMFPPNTPDVIAARVALIYGDLA